MPDSHDKEPPKKPSFDPPPQTLRGVRMMPSSFEPGKAPSPEEPISCCGSEVKSEASSCCTPKGKRDWLLLVSGSIVAFSIIAILLPVTLPVWLQRFTHDCASLMKQMWWGLLAGIVFVGLLARMPRELILGVIGRPGSNAGLFRATAAGLLLDLCSHGILLVGMQMYRKGASIGQTAAFLIASPWNSFSLTLILFALIGVKWTLTFIALSALIALTSGWILDRLVKRGTLGKNPNSIDLPEGFSFKKEAAKGWKNLRLNRKFFRTVATDGLRESKMILRWIFFGVVLTSLIRNLLDPDVFQQYFGPTLLGLLLTLIATTVIEVCSEGSSPIAADLLNRAAAPGNGFTFLMAGVATDYTEIMSLKETTRSWKTALFLPLVTVPQTVAIGWILNNM